jgi:hypothetical protein
MTLESADVISPPVAVQIAEGGISWFVILFGGLGDQVLWLSLLPEFRRRREGKVVAFVSKGGAHELAGFFEGRAFDCMQLFDTPPAVPMPDTTSHFEPTRILRTSHIFFDANERYLLIERYDVGIADLLRIILDLPTNTLMAEPEIPLRNRFAAAERMEALGLPVGRTVLLAPWANTWRCRLSDAWWIGAVRFLTGKGFSVVTNVGNRGRSFDGATPTVPLPMIPGTIPVEVPVGEIIPFAEYCGYFLGARSGLCDLLARAQARKMVLYPFDDSPLPYITGLPLDRACHFWSVGRAFQQPSIIEEKVDSTKEFDPTIFAKWLDA